jgi:hypothetical protein
VVLSTLTCDATAEQTHIVSVVHTKNNTHTFFMYTRNTSVQLESEGAKGNYASPKRSRSSASAGSTAARLFSCTCGCGCGCGWDGMAWLLLVKVLGFW